MLKWLLNNQKSIAISIFVALVLFLVWNLWTMINHLDTSYMYTHSLDSNSTDTSEMSQRWAIRGQMGDILSGHFSALAFLAVALSVFLQNEANRQMKKSIDKQDEALNQQSKALEVQSESLKAQIEALQQSHKESERQTEEFFIANMNVKLDRYHKMFDSQVEKVVRTEAVKHYTSYKIQNPKMEYGIYEKTLFNQACNEIDTLLQIINAIHADIINLQRTYPQASKNFRKE